MTTLGWAHLAASPKGRDAARAPDTYRARLGAGTEAVRIARGVDGVKRVETYLLIGVVNQQAKVDKIVAHARATDGVVTVKSFLQVMGK